jgi:hypothetical protein
MIFRLELLGAISSAPTVYRILGKRPRLLLGTTNNHGMSLRSPVCLYVPINLLIIKRAKLAYFYCDLGPFN